MMRRQMLMLAVIVVGAMALGGCERFTRANFDMVQPGQAQWEVQKLIGDTPYKFSNTWSYIHREPFYKAVIEFDADGKVASKSWYDATEMGTHPDAR